MNDAIGKCSKCGMTVKLARCKKNVAARVIIQDHKGANRTVSMFGDTIKLLTHDVQGDDLEMQILSADALDFQINAANVVFNISNCASIV